MNKPAERVGVAAARSHFPALERWTYMDVAGRGVLSREVRAALDAHLDDRMLNGATSKDKLNKQKNLYLYLCYSIMSQQLSTKVAKVIKQRFLDLYGGEPTPQQIMDTPFEKLRAIGLSNAKVSYVQNVARFEIEKGMDHKKLSTMSNEEVIEYLTQIKGVGRWTTEMLLMFALCREDLFAIDDLGLQQAVISLYDLKHRKKKIMNARILKIAEQWAPYRTYACMYLWRWKDNPPVTNEKKRKVNLKAT